MIAAATDPQLIGRLTGWLAEQRLPLIDLRAGAQRLEDVFRRLTTAPGTGSDDGSDGADVVNVGTQRLAAQVRTELQLVARNGEQLLLTLGIPVLLLVFFSSVDVLPTARSPSGDPVDFLAPGVLALAVMSTAMVSLGIGTGFERTYLVLKRLGATPLGRTRLIVAKIVGVLVVELVQFAVLVPVAVRARLAARRPAAGCWPSPAVALGTIAFAGIGLTLAGRLRGEINLAAQNGLYLVLLLLGGMVIPFGELPGPLRAVATAAARRPRWPTCCARRSAGWATGPARRGWCWPRGPWRHRSSRVECSASSDVARTVGRLAAVERRGHLVVGERRLVVHR